ncbi:MAG: hypothetical protein QUS14_14575 [Pyrinomonadaceae bacterium]|nr:hypothetical protein [Pyrinomonadaceae bacterium]
MLSKFLMVSAVVVSVVFFVSCGSTGPNNNSSSANKPGSSNASSTANAAPAASVRKAEITATAEELAKEYKADSKSVDKYKEKVVEVRGKFNRSSGSAEAPEVQFETGNDVFVTCRLSPSAFQAAAKFEKGQDIRMTGIGYPYTISGPIFKDCEIAQ